MGLSALLEPNGIAVIGASKSSGKLGNDTMANVQSYDTPIYPVNPSSSGSVFGYEFVDSVHETNADLALCCVPGSILPGILEECGEAGIGAAVVFAGGFAEVNQKGKDLQRTVEQIADEYGITIIGPNTAGYILPERDLYASFVRGVSDIEKGNVAVVAQSGGVGMTTAFQLDREGYGVSAMFGLGNRVNTGFEEIIPKLDEDPQTDAIALHVEGTSNIENIFEICRNSTTPIISFKAGNEDINDMVQAHTAAPIQNYDTYRQGFSGSGNVLTSSITELIDASRAIANTPSPNGPNVGVVTAQAGPGIIIADYLKHRGIEFPNLDKETQDQIDEILPGITFTDNPVDTGRPIPEFGDVIESVARDENIDIILVYQIYEEAIGYPVKTLKTLTDEIDKPILFTVAGPHDALAEERWQIEDLGIPTFDSPERGAYAVSSLVESISNNEKSTPMVVHRSNR